MKIAMLTDSYRPVINGITNFIATCKQEMERAGHQVFVFTFGHLDYRDRESGVVRSPGIPLSDTGYYFSVEYSHQAREKLAQMDLLHIHHPFTSGQAGIRHGKRLGLPVVFTNHTRYDLYASEYFPLVSPELINRVLARYMSTFSADCDLVVAPSRGLYRVALGWGVGAKMVVIPNGIDLERFRKPALPVSRAELGIPEAATLLIYSGRLSPEKNLGMLLDAFARVAPAAPDAFLLLIGGGPDEELLRERAAGLERVRFTGWVAYEKLPGYLALGDLFVTASVTEVHPLVVIEALAAGLPVVGIRSPGISGTVREGVDGLLTDDDEEEYAAAILQLIRGTKLRPAMSRAARRRSRAFDIRITARALLDQYQRLVSGG